VLPNWATNLTELGDDASPSSPNRPHPHDHRPQNYTGTAPGKISQIDMSMTPPLQDCGYTLSESVLRTSM
jgi:hypothetical protein